MARTSGSAGGVSTAALARRAVLPNRRLPHVVTAIGDSRVAALWSDAGGARRNRSAASPLNMANALLGHRLLIGDGFGVGNDRTDQMLARLPAVLASNAGLLYILGGLNDVGYEYPTAATSGATAFANIRTMAEAARSAGMTVVIELEVGSNSIGAAQVAQVVELNALLLEYAEGAPGVYLHDARPVVLNPGFSTSTIGFRAGYTYDGVHMNGRGALYWGESLAQFLETLVPQRPGRLSVNAYEVVGTSRRQMLANHSFTTASGGVQGSGITGTVPGSWTTDKSASASLAVAVAAKASGFGNEVQLDCGFTAAGQYARIYQDVASTSSWNAGEYYEAFARVRILGTPSALGRVALHAQCNTSPGGSQDFIDGDQSNSWLGPDHAATLTLVTRPYLVPALTGKGWLTAGIVLWGSGLGSASVVIEQIGIRRRGTGY